MKLKIYKNQFMIGQKKQNPYLKIMYLKKFFINTPKNQLLKNIELRTQNDK